MKKRVLVLIIVIVTVAAVSMSVLAKAGDKKEELDGGYFSNLKELKQISEIMDIVRTKFVGEKEITREDLVHGAIKGMIEVLDDPHSNYFSKKEMKEFTQDIKGEYAGVGMVVGKQDNILTVVSPIEDTPAQKAGMRPKDKILKIENESTLDLNLEKCVEKLKGQAGSKVKILVAREGVEKPFEVTLERAVIKLKYVKYKMLDNNIGYLRLTQFGENVSQDVRKAVEDMLLKQNMKSMILDLRNDPGGSLSEAINVASIFIDKSPIVTVKEKSGQTEVYDPKGKAYTNFPLVVLINEGSASASEIVAGAVKDHKRGILVGEKTYGKGSVQNLMPFEGGDGMKLTIAKYYTPSGVCIHKIGIQPDIIIEEKDDGAFYEGMVMNVMDEKKDDAKDNKKEEKKDNDNKSTDTSDKKDKKEEKKKEDMQLKEAVNILKGFDLFNKLK